MNIDEFGNVTISETEMIEVLYSGKKVELSEIFLDNITKILQYNQANKSNFTELPELKESLNLNLSVKDFDERNQTNWFMPENYFPNLVDYLYNSCTTQEQKNRVDQELKLFKKHNMINVLHYLKYLVDTMRENNVVWGVGRGSSVASYILYLIGIHKIDSIKYELDINEFLK